MKPRTNPTYRIYSIRDSDGNVRYVGLTRGPLLKRLWIHASAKTPVGEWIRAEMSAKRIVRIRLEEESKGKSKEMHARERQLIAKYHEQYGDLMFNTHGIPNAKINFLVEEDVANKSESA